jgi:hypothetical protein
VSLYGETVQSYIKSHLHWLNYYWEIYGNVKPKADTDRVDGFDDDYWYPQVAEVAKANGLDLVPAWVARQRKLEM